METCSLSWIGGYNIYYLWYLIQDATAVNTHNSARQQLEHYLQNQFPLKTTLTVTQHLFSYENNHNIHNITLQSNDKACILSKSVTKHCKQSNQNIRTTGCWNKACRYTKPIIMIIGNDQCYQWITESLPLCLVTMLLLLVADWCIVLPGSA